MLACAGAQPAFGSSLVVSALTFGIHASDHGHSVALRSDGDHLDIVVSHTERDAHEPGAAARGHAHPVGVSEGDHVVHVTASDLANTKFRRLLLEPTHALSSPVASPLALTPKRVPPRAPDVHACGADQLRTVVLRL